MTPSQSPFSGSFPQAKRPSSAPPSPPSSTQTRYAPNRNAIASEIQITDVDVLAVIDARGGQTYSASVDTGLANRFPFVDASERQRAVQRALKSGAVVRTPMGIFRRPPRDNE